MKSQRPKKETPAPGRRLTSQEEFDNLSPADRFKLLSDAEFDAIGFERLYRAKQQEMETEIQKLQFTIKQLEKAGEEEIRVINQQSREIKDLGDDKRALLRQINELSQIPLRS